MNYNHYICSAFIMSLLMIPQRTIAQSNGHNHIVSQTMLDSLGSSTIKTVQYYDGLGRPDVLATGGLSTNGKYVYTKTDYNMLGQESRKWLPVIGGTTADFIDAEYLASSSSDTYDDDYAFSDITYDALGRPIVHSTPGQAWNQNHKVVSTEYKTNTTANNVKLYIMTSAANGTFSQQGYHEPSTLTCEKTTDEDGHTIEVFKDFMDNVILERRNGNNDTYYVYDKGLLCVVIPPLYQTNP